MLYFSVGYCFMAPNTRKKKQNFSGFTFLLLKTAPPKTTSLSVPCEHASIVDTENDRRAMCSCIKHSREERKTVTRVDSHFINFHAFMSLSRISTPSLLFDRALTLLFSRRFRYFILQRNVSEVTRNNFSLMLCFASFSARVDKTEIFLDRFSSRSIARVEACSTFPLRFINGFCQLTNNVPLSHMV